MSKILNPKSPHNFAANTYILVSDGECAVVDPTVPYEPSAEYGKVKFIILTHAHFDHMLDIDSWRDGTGAEVIVSHADKDALADSHRNCYKVFSGQDRGYSGEATAVREGDVITVGSEKLTVIECPGHTAGSMVLRGDGFAFVGDTVFAGGGYGRWDLPTGDYSALVTSIQKLIELPQDTVLYSGHGPSFTVKDFKQDYSTKRIL